MQTMAIIPKDREEWLALRRQDITASQIAALIGQHPYLTPYALWCDKTGKSPDDLDSPAMRRGRLLESVGFNLTRAELTEHTLFATSTDFGYWRAPAERIGATPDILATSKDDPNAFGVVQIKSVEPSIYRRAWPDGEPPLWVALQALTEMKLTGAKWARVGVLRVGFAVEFDLVEVPIIESVWPQLVDRVGEFWRNVETDNPPVPDYARDAELISRMLTTSSATTIDLSDDRELCLAVVERESIRTQIKLLSQDLDALDGHIRFKAGEAETVLAGEYRVSLKTEDVKAYQVAARTRRPIRIRPLIRKSA